MTLFYHDSLLSDKKTKQDWGAFCTLHPVDSGGYIIMPDRNRKSVTVLSMASAEIFRGIICSQTSCAVLPHCFTDCTCARESVLFV